MCQPIEFGTCEEGVYSIQSWIEGKDAEQIIPDCSHIPDMIVTMLVYLRSVFQ